MDVRTGERSDDLDVLLSAAACRAADDSGRITGALHQLIDARVSEVHANGRNRKFLVPAAIAGALLALVGAGAAVATQWAPWVTEADNPDVVFTREWDDASGTYLGYCEGRIEVVHWDPDQVAATRTYLATVNVDDLEPNLEWLAMRLARQGELDRLGDLVEGADPADFEDPGSLAPQEKMSDANLLHNALMRTVLDGMHAAMNDPKLSATGDVQCTTDSMNSGDQ
ncbi:hypothetical protein HF576_18215 [Microbacterium sp. CFH 90308]|uniref:DUF5667 domain-containing protein n=1 Tax=Microbacterium salsuginis TaxID=2722803 RepID=A0ABX1KHK5_9MICO|nr:hypothetical protein [Microbacterium sp. CFH 90308]NLP85773.1 hypothetical protein [Microbacterium sp. CFH 90308]